MGNIIRGIVGATVTEGGRAGANALRSCIK